MEYLPTPITEEWSKQQAELNKQPVNFKGSDFFTGFGEENLTVIGAKWLFDNQDFPPDETYNPSTDPQLQGYEDFSHLFMFSKSAYETTSIMEKLKKHQEINYASPWYHLGRVTGAFTDPSTLLLFTKVGQAAKVFGSAMLGEELLKQNMDPIRDDSYVPWVAAGGYSIPAVINKLTQVKVPLSIKKNIDEADDYWIEGAKRSSKNPKLEIQKTKNQNDIMEDGNPVPPNKLDAAPSSVGAEGITGTKLSTPKKRMDGEKFVESNLKIFGEDGPWTPVFRVINQKVSSTARTMMAALLDTPLLKLKNTKAWGFDATGKSIETDMRMMRVGEIESHKMVKDQFLNYVKRQQAETGSSVPKTNIGLAIKNKLTDGYYSLDQFAKEVTIARLNGMTHDVPEIAAAARNTDEFVYKPLFQQIKDLKIRELPIISELRFWEAQLKQMREKGLGSKTYKSKIDGTTTTYNISRIEKTIEELTDRLKAIQSGSGVKNYINLVYVKNAIDKNKELFKKIIRDDLTRKGKIINEAKLNELVHDLSNHFPFTPPRKGDYDLNQRYVFKDPRYARAIRSRELNLDEIAQKELIKANMIVSDIFALQKIYARQVIPDILLTKKYGDPNGLGFRFIEDGEMSGFAPGLMSVSNDFNLKMAMGNKGNRAKLLKERDQTLGDLEAAIELIKGTYGLPANPHAWTSVAMRTAKHYNALTMLTGFFAAVPDIARITMTSGIKRGFKTQFEMFSDFLDGATLFKTGKKEAQSFGEAVDMITGQRAMLFADVGDMFGLANKFEGAMGKVSAMNFMYVNLMSRWTEMAKSMASVTIGSRILEDSIKWGKGTLGDKWKTALSSSGIDKEMARRIAVQFEKHGTKTKHNYMANTIKWQDDAARDAFGAALNKDINITIVTPGLGDTPKWMSTELGSTFAQFKKFAMSSTQRMLMRGMQERDLDFLFGAMMLMGSGMLIDSVYHKVRFNRDYDKLSLTQKLLNAFDRSGLAGIYTDVNKAIETLTDNRFGISPMLGEKKPYGSSGRWKAGTLFGPTGGQIYNIFDIMFDVGGNKYNHHTAKNVRRLIPFQNVWYLDWLFDDIQKGLRFK